MNGIIKGIKLYESTSIKSKLSEELSSRPGINPVTGKKFKKPVYDVNVVNKQAGGTAAPKTGKSSTVPQGGGRVRGAGLSQTPNAIKKRQQRAAAKTVGAAPQAQQPAAPAAQTKPAAPAAPAAQTKPAAPAAQAAKPKNKSAGGSLSPAEYMYKYVILNQLRGMNVDQHKTTISNALKKWETAVKNQINNANGKFSGKFEGETQTAYENLANLLSSIAFSSLSAKNPEN